MSMRSFLDRLYDGAAALAAVFMVALLVMVLTSILGREIGFHLRGTDAYSGYFMAASGFLALAHTLKRGEHIRVTLLTGRLRGKARQRLELWALGLACLLSLLLAFYSVRLCWHSRLFNDISTGNDATPLWIPQLSMAVGAVILCIALVDEWVLELRGKREQAGADQPLHNE